MSSDHFTVRGPMHEQATHEQATHEQATHEQATHDQERSSSAGSGPRLGRRPHRWRNWWGSGRHLAVGASLAFGVMACSPSPDAALEDTVGAASTATSGAALAAMGPTDTVTVTVYKTPTCGCCRAWVDHLRAEGFRVETVDRDDLTMVKAVNAVPGQLQSCHTATVGGYVVEGHVPAGDIRRLLAERPPVAGVAVPGMPVGSPGMEVPGTPADRYDVLSFDRSGSTAVFASH